MSEKSQVATLEGKGTYSIHYLREGYETRALDWNWREPDVWAASCLEYAASSWYLIKESPEKIRSALLAHFFLTDWEDEFPLERIVQMSPRQLAAERRKKEAAEPTHLLPVEMKSDTLGYHVNAEDHPG